MKQRTKAEWENLVRDYRSSGKSLKVWCDENEINYKTMSGHTHLMPAHNARRSEKEWIALINEMKASGMSREGWCRERGINSSSMLSAEKRLKTKLASDNVDLATRTSPHCKENVFTEANTDVSQYTDSVSPKWIEI